MNNAPSSTPPTAPTRQRQPAVRIPAIAPNARAYARRYANWTLVARALIVIGFGGWLALQTLTPATNASADAHTAALLSLNRTIDPVAVRLVSRAVEDAEESGATILIIQLNTPGGLLESTREIVSAIFNANIPVIVYVSPSGAQAASAGTFIAAAAHLSAMAPATNIGAASPVGAGGEDLPDTIKSKATQDAAAFMRSIADRRGRPPDAVKALEAAVLDAESYAPQEAIDLNIIDFNADRVQDLLSQIDGVPIALDTADEPIVIDADGIAITPIQPTFVDQFLAAIANPNIAFILLTIGGIGILIELLSPGLFGPGAVGVIALALAFLAFGSLPVNWVGVGLIMLGIALFYIEAQAPGVGIFGVSGAAAFIIGAFLLFGDFSLTPPTPALPDAPSFRLHPYLIIGVAALMSGALALTIRAVRQAKTAPAYRGSEGPQSLIGRVGVAATDINPRGSVQIGGERWSAAAADDSPIASGESVIVSDAQGLTLIVFKADDP